MLQYSTWWYAHVVIPVEQHQQGRYGGRQQEETVLSEYIRVKQTSPIMQPHAALLLRVVSVQRREVDVRRRVVDRPVLVRRAEDAVDDERREGEHERGQAGRVRCELPECYFPTESSEILRTYLFTLEKHIEHKSRIGQNSIGQRLLLLDSARICSLRCTEARHRHVVLRAIRSTPCEFV